MFKLVLEKAEKPEIKLPTSTGSSKKEEFQKNIYFGFIDYAKAIDSVDYNKLENYSTGKFLKRGKYHATLPTSWEICIQVKKQQLELDMGQQDWFQIRKGVHQGYILSPCLFNLYAE